ncbi:25S rRNA (adenine645-N1)-methyltransferase [Aspergillus nanangensis]|uniref:Ribosomal RNA-processing protein 8 n=1 Tax=Aspergillus nanangensis TaxID=2582783 RepID=A0AAD4CW57_ASPNN|nr:25S rRNA (adenine645-N1)-methyltransferase [Aspergillus nanangensis]
MFAVPGWSVSSSALQQQTTQSAAQSPKQSQQANGSSNSDAKSNKRKRDDNVTKSNVDLMYRRIIEGQKPPRQRKKTEKKPKNLEKDNVQSQTKSQGSDEESKAKEEMGDQQQPATDDDKATKKQKKNRNRNKPKQKLQEETSKEASVGNDSLPTVPPKTGATLTPLQQAMRQKLISSRFRHLNETLYTTPSAKALELFTASPELFDEYHAGFSRQVKESWPLNPVDGYIAAIRARAKVSVKRGAKPDRNKTQPLPRRPNGGCKIVDLGCGDAQLARGINPSAKKLDLKLFSYDLHAPEGSPITKADISNLPLEDGSVDVAIFCLSLMGTNWVSFVEEAWRVLRGDGKGECWVSEVKSRFGKVVRKKAQIGARKPMSKAEKKKLKKKQGDDEAGSDVDDDDVYAEDARPANNDDETDISAFVEVFRTRGFVLKPESVDKSNKMFVKMEFVKQGNSPLKGKHASSAAPAPAAGKKRFIEKTKEIPNNLSAEDEAAVLKPCVYKIR